MGTSEYNCHFETGNWPRSSPIFISTIKVVFVRGRASLVVLGPLVGGSMFKLHLSMFNILNKFSILIGIHSIAYATCCIF